MLLARPDRPAEARPGVARPRQVPRRDGRGGRRSWSVRGWCAISRPSKNPPTSAPGSGSCSRTATATARTPASSSATGVPTAASRSTRHKTEESVVDLRARKQGTDYLRDHLSRLPVVVAARVGRVWSVFRPSQNVELDAFYERRGTAESWAVLVAYYVMLVLSIAGLVVLRRRRVPIFPYIAIALSVTITVALSFGITRYRAPVDVVMPLLARSRSTRSSGGERTRPTTRRTRRRTCARAHRARHRRLTRPRRPPSKRTRAAVASPSDADRSRARQPAQHRAARGGAAGGALRRRALPALALRREPVRSRHPARRRRGRRARRALRARSPSATAVPTASCRRRSRCTR